MADLDAALRKLPRLGEDATRFEADIQKVRASMKEFDTSEEDGKSGLGLNEMTFISSWPYSKGRFCWLVLRELQESCHRG
jgi:hypothetical protein